MGRLALVSAALFPALTVLRESLWIDELHTAWIVQGPWSELLDRCQAGNQTPLYFAFLKLFCSVFGLSELTLRFPSVLAWGWMLLQLLAGLRGKWSLAILVTLFFFDQTSLFYATEARPYAFVASFFTWLLLRDYPTTQQHQPGVEAQSANGVASRFSRIRHRSIRPSVDFWWVAVACLTIQLHLTAILPVLVLCSMRCFRIPRFFSSGLLETAIVGVASVLSLPLSFQVWGKRADWSEFAIPTDVFQSLTLFPWVVWLVVPALLSLHRSRKGKRGPRNASESILPSNTLEQKGKGSEQRALSVRSLAVGVVFPSLVGAIALLGLMPLFHARYLIAVYPAIVIFSALQLNRWIVRQQHWKQVVFGLTGVCLLCLTQSHVANWRAGYVFGWPRMEGWKAAFDEVDSRLRSINRIDAKTIGSQKPGRTDKPAILVAPGLIEMHRKEIDEDYLRFCIDSLYRPSWRDSARIVRQNPVRVEEILTEQQTFFAYWIVRRPELRFEIPAVGDFFAGTALRLRADLSFGYVRVLKIELQNSDLELATN